jgi:hypothetical protein
LVPSDEDSFSFAATFVNRVCRNGAFVV